MPWRTGGARTFLSHDGIVAHGCSVFCEMLEQTIARVAAICSRDGLEMPSRLCVSSQTRLLRKLKILKRVNACHQEKTDFKG